MLNARIELEKKLRKVSELERIYDLVLENMQWNFMDNVFDEDGQQVYDEDGNRLYKEPEDKDSWKYEAYQEKAPIWREVLAMIEKMAK